MCQNVLVFPNIYCSEKELKHFGLVIFWIIRSTKLLIFFLNICFVTTCCKNQTRKTISSLYVLKCSNYSILYTLKVLLSKKPILYTLKALLSKNRFYFFFLIFWHLKIPPSSRAAFGINSSFNYFLSVLHFSNLICQAKRLKKAVLIRLKIKTIHS